MNYQIFDTLLEPVFILNREQKVLYCNEPAALMIDISVRKIMRAESFSSLFKFSEPIQALQQLEQVTDPSPYQEVQFDAESGKHGKVQITLQKLEDGETPTWLIFFRDVTLEETLQKKYRAELEAKEDYINELKKAQQELKNYSENLEKMVEARTAEIARMNQLMGALLDSLHQGFFIFDANGMCLPVSSKACLNVIEKDPKGLEIWKVLGLSEKEAPGFQKWTTTAFAEMLPFEDLAPLAPPTFKHSQGLEIKLEYFPLRDETSVIQGVVVVASDITDLIKAQKDAETERTHVQMLLQLMKNKRQITSFLRECETLVTDLEKEFQAAKPDPENIFRLLHTIKGGSASFSIQSLADTCHHAETLLSEWKQTQDEQIWTQLKNTAHGVPLQFEQFKMDNRDFLGSEEKNNERWVEHSASHIKKFSATLPSIHQQKFVDEFLTEPIENYFTHFNEVMQSVAERENKSLNAHLLMNGELKIIPEIYEGLFTTLIHAYRNAVDHGIETTEARLEKQKNDRGTICTKFSTLHTADGEWLQIEIVDDGGGISPDKIREKLLSRGVDTSAETDEQVIQHIFDSQFSTRDQVTETSGRGVGMDAILTASQQLGGSAFVRSKVGQGTTLTILVPYIRNMSSSSPSTKPTLKLAV